MGTKAKHTPGDWGVKVAGRLIEIVSDSGDDRPIVHWTGFDASPYSQEICIANAVLMAAAPELAEACGAMLRHLCWSTSKERYAHTDEQLADMLRAALAKAGVEVPQ